MKFKSGAKVVRRYNLKVYTVQNSYDAIDYPSYLIVRNQGPSKPWGTWELEKDIRLATNTEIKNGYALEF